MSCFNLIRSNMKKLTLLALSGIALLALDSCSTSKMAKGTGEKDDIYYSMKDAKAERKALAKAREEEEQRLKEEAEARELSEKQREARSKPGSDYYDEPFDYDDYYDYEYAARLRRFNSPVPGYGYYDTYYTNSYFYTNNPYNYGTSIYNGYNFWGPQYQMYNYNPSSFWYWNQGWGWGIGSGMTYMSPVYMSPGMGYTSGWGNPYWGNPWGPSYGCGWGNSWGNGWYDPWYGWNSYNDPYWMGYQAGMMQNGGWGNNNYFNSYDNNSAYYGPRGSTNGTGGRGEAVQNGTLGELVMREVAAENGAETMSRDEVNTALNPPATESRPVYGINTGSGTSTPAAPAVTPGRSSTTPISSVPAPPANTTIDRGGSTSAPSPGSNTAPPLPPRPRVNDQPAPNLNTTPRNTETPRSTPRFDTGGSSPSSSTPSSSPSSTPRSSSGSSDSSPRSSGSSGSSSRPR
jgi:hypothetical protein